MTNTKHKHNYWHIISTLKPHKIWRSKQEVSQANSETTLTLNLVSSPANKIRWPNALLMMDQRRRRQPIIKRALGQRRVFAAWDNISSQWSDKANTRFTTMLGWGWADLVDCGPASTQHWHNVSCFAGLSRTADDPDTHFICVLILELWS